MKGRLGLFHRRECVVPTFRGWAVILLLCGALAAVFLFGSYPFLAQHDPKPGGVLVVEGWASEEAMRAVVDEFKSNHYEAIYSTGGTIEASSPLAPFKSFSEYGATVLTGLGCDPKAVRTVPTPWVVKDRTYSSAAALHKMLKEEGRMPKFVNLYSVGVHSRRSRMLFQKAFGADAEVGVVASEEGEYDPKRWWVSSAGFRNVTGEIIAYLYARFLFTPTAE